MAEQLRMSLERAEVDVILEKDGEEKHWKLLELLGRERNRYLNKLTSRVKVGKDGKAIGIKSFDGFQLDLLSLCLYDEAGNLVDKETIEGLPSRTQQALFKKAQEISGLEDEEDSEDARSKND